MHELVPVLFSFAMGVPIVRDTTAHRRIVLSLLIVAASATLATLSSDEFRLNWALGLLDLGEAAFGIALAFAFVQVLERAKRRVQAREFR